MSATNKTTNLELPLFIGTDVPSWLTDWNGAMTTLDTNIATVKSSTEIAVSQAENAVESAAQTAQGLVSTSNTVSQIQQNISVISQKLTFTLQKITLSTGFTGNQGSIIHNSDYSMSSIKFNIGTSDIGTLHGIESAYNTYFFSYGQITGNPFNLTPYTTRPAGTFLCSAYSSYSDGTYLVHYMYFNGTNTIFCFESSTSTYNKNLRFGYTIPFFNTGTTIQA